MARRKKRNFFNPDSFNVVPNFDLEPETKKAIFAVIVLTIGLLAWLSLFGVAGVLGGHLAGVFAFVLGWGKWLFPLVLTFWGWLLLKREPAGVKGAIYFGLCIIVITLETSFHLFLSPEKWQAAVDAGSGGGWVGMQLAGFFLTFLGFWGGLLILVCLLSISIMLMFNRALVDFFGEDSLMGKLIFPFAWVARKVLGRKDEEEEEENEDEDEGEEGEESEDEDNEDEGDEENEDEAEDEPDFDQHPVPNLVNRQPSKPVETRTWLPSNVDIDMPLDLLSDKVGKPTSGDIKGNGIVIQRTLENFGIPVEMGDVTVGPTVTQYTFKPAEGIKLSRITTLSNNLALALAAHTIRIEAPIPGKSLVGVEVPNQTKAIVGLREILESDQFQQRKTNLLVALGKDVTGKAWLYDLSKMPHLLVAGQTNSGKSVCLNSIIVSLLYQNNPDDLRFVMVDPKRVELTPYNGIPHLLTPVITDVSKTVNALKWCINEMERRFDVLQKNRKVNIQDYNQMAMRQKPGKMEKLPYVVFVIDELADLMSIAAKDVEASIIRLTQMARAVGIHMILATQRPSVDVITGLIKANLPARTAFAVASAIDSKTILDSSGAEKLLGKGDMLFSTAEDSKPRRLQGAFVSTMEIRRVVEYIKDAAGDPNYLDNVTERQRVKGMPSSGGSSNGDADDDELLEEAKEIVINSGKASTSFLQRRLSIGYGRAARILDVLEEMGIVTVGNGSKGREVLVSKEQYESMINQGVSGVSLHRREEAEVPESYLPDEDEEEEEEAEESEEESSDDENEEDENSDKSTEDDNNEEEEEEEREIKPKKSVATPPSQKVDKTKPPKLPRTPEAEDFDKLFSR
ncbi:MAG: DNA translocase FtsK [Candidatus Falkowbacteria bacterium]